MRCGALRFVATEIGFDAFDSQRLKLLSGSNAGSIFFWHRVWLWHHAHRDVNIFEDLARSDAENSVARFDQVVAFAAAVLPSQVIGEAEVGVELFGFDEESGAVCLPFQ